MSRHRGLRRLGTLLAAGRNTPRRLVGTESWLSFATEPKRVHERCRVGTTAACHSWHQLAAWAMKATAKSLYLPLEAVIAALAQLNQCRLSEAVMALCSQHGPCPGTANRTVVVAACSRHILAAALNTEHVHCTLLWPCTAKQFR
eukprot:GHUV01043111.1.p1 GENE.GHUV01043111.1~~GHUV01043111.1.p1  ORF type:complete len:145 (+),score=13.99 GHUV01043111.1:778-1212(+)